MKNGLSRLENVLTRHMRAALQRTFTADQIRYLSFGMSLVTCLLDANVSVFSLYTPAFIAGLNYTQVSINIISGAMLLGLYLTLPLLGYFADAHGPVLLALIGLLVSPGYFLAWKVYEARAGEWWMAVAFFLIGTGTSSAYFCSLLTCARVFPDRKGLSISLPVSCYGLSAFLLAWLLTWDVFVDQATGQLHIQRVFLSLTALYAVVCAVNWVSSVVVSLEKEIVFSRLFEEERAERAAQADPQTDAPAGYGAVGSSGAGAPSGAGGPRPRPAADGVAHGTTTTPSAGGGPAAADEEAGLLDAGVVDTATHGDRFRAFLRDPSMRLVLAALFCLAGPLELYISNLGSILKNAPGSSGDERQISTQVAVFAVASTATRLSMGVLSDVFNSCRSTVRLIFAAVALTAAGFTLVAAGTRHAGLVSIVLGTAYGTVFTMFPTLVATVWGVEIFGSTWGLFLAAPAVGSILFGLFYALEYDSHCGASGVAAGGRGAPPGPPGGGFCLRTPFAVFAVVAVAGGLCVQAGWHCYWRPQQEEAEEQQKRGCR